MIQSKPKACKGTGKAIGYGCGKPLNFTERNGIKTYNSKYGLCPSCQYEWATTNNNGKEWFSKQLEIKKKKHKKEEKAAARKYKSENNESAAMSLADTYFSRFIRLKHSEDGLCTCYTCGTVKPIKEVDNGHYQKRTHKVVRYNENNCRPQCKTCNGDTLHNGKQVEFRINLINEIGIEEVEEMEAAVKVTGKYTTSFYKEKADYYRTAVNELQKKLGVKYW